MSYFDLLRTRKYFDIFLKHFNSTYGKQTASAPGEVVTITLPNGTTQADLMRFQKHLARTPKRSGEEKEPHYRSLIKRYYGIDQGARSTTTISSSRADVAALIADPDHIKDVYESLRKEFYRRQARRLLPLEEVSDSIHHHKQLLINLSKYTMESINPGTIPEELFEGLNQLFCGLKVVRPKVHGAETKVVAVSKIMHFLLPDLVMPVDREKVLRFLRKRGGPLDQQKQFDLFVDVLKRYIELASHLGLTSSNGDGSWWNISVPKRIDNAIEGFWDIFNDANLERVICGNIDMLLKYLNIR